MCSKSNPRSTPIEAIAAVRVENADTLWCHWREGKRQCVWADTLQLVGVGSEEKPVRRIYRLTERTIDKVGNPLLLPDYQLEGWTTTLPTHFAPAQIIALYCEHGTPEFDTNARKYLICIGRPLNLPLQQGKLGVEGGFVEFESGEDRCLVLMDGGDRGDGRG